LSFLGTGASNLSSFTSGVAAHSRSVPNIGENFNILPVPYSSQGNTNWCYQTALSMVLQYNGKKVYPSDITRAKNQSAGTATSILDILFGWVGS
jgi:uncharacterized protein YvpB